MEAKTLEEVTQAIIDYRGKTPLKSDSGIRLVTAKVVKDGFILDEKPEYISEKTYDKWMTRGIPEQRDILITTEAPLGEVAQIRINTKIALAQRIILLRGDPKIINQDYLFHSLKSPFVQNQLKERATGTTVLGIRQSELMKIKIPYYPFEYQESIAHILSPFDDLIEVNIRRARILEEIAQSVYNEWFVKLNYPGYEDAEIIQTRHGPKPKGWEWKKIGDVNEFAYGKALKNVDRISGNFPVYGSSGVVGSHVDYLVEGPAIIVGRKGNVGSVYWSHDNCYPIDTVFYIKTKLSPYYIYFNFQRQNFINSDAAVPGLSRRQAYNLPILIPSQRVLKLFEDFVNPVFEQIHNLEKENERLCQIRDMLLPKLISGEISPRELDVAVSGV